MGTPYLGEIRMVSFNFAPKGWASCNGQTLPINQNMALFSLLGTTYGGDGRTTFQLPDLRGRIPLHQNLGGGRPTFPIGTRAGEEMHTLVAQELPAHSHLPMASTATVNQPSPVGNFWGSGANNPQYSTAPISTPMGTGMIGNNTGGQPHENRAPYNVLNFVIALQGIFPSQN